MSNPIMEKIHILPAQSGYKRFDESPPPPSTPQQAAGGRKLFSFVFLAVSFCLFAALLFTLAEIYLSRRAHEDQILDQLATSQADAQFNTVYNDNRYQSHPKYISSAKSNGRSSSNENSINEKVVDVPKDYFSSNPISSDSFSQSREFGKKASASSSSSSAAREHSRPAAIGRLSNNQPIKTLGKSSSSSSSSEEEISVAKRPFSKNPVFSQSSSSEEKVRQDVIKSSSSEEQAKPRFGQSSSSEEKSKSSAFVQSSSSEAVVGLSQSGSSEKVDKIVFSQSSSSEENGKPDSVQSSSSEKALVRQPFPDQSSSSEELEKPVPVTIQDTEMVEYVMPDYLSSQSSNFNDDSQQNKEVVFVNFGSDESGSMDAIRELFGPQPPQKGLAVMAQPGQLAPPVESMQTPSGLALAEESDENDNGFLGNDQQFSAVRPSEADDVDISPQTQELPKPPPFLPQQRDMVGVEQAPVGSRILFQNRDPSVADASNEAPASEAVDQISPIDEVIVLEQAQEEAVIPQGQADGSTSDVTNTDYAAVAAETVKNGDADGGNTDGDGNSKMLNNEQSSMPVLADVPPSKSYADSGEDDPLKSVASGPEDPRRDPEDSIVDSSRVPSDPNDPRFIHTSSSDQQQPASEVSEFSEEQDV